MVEPTSTRPTQLQGAMHRDTHLSSPFPISKLPLEIRDLIFAIFIKDAQNSKRCCRFRDYADGEEILSTGLYGPLVVLSQTCKGFHNVLSPALYKDAGFTFENCGPDPSDMEFDNQLLVPGFIQYDLITSIDIIVGLSFDAEELLEDLMTRLCWGKNLSSFYIDFRYCYKQGECEPESIFDVLDMWPRLRMRCGADIDLGDLGYMDRRLRDEFMGQ